MSDANRGGLGPIIMLVTLLVGGVVLENQINLQGSRPLLKSEVHHQHMDEEDVDARLWQDPFQAVDQAIKHRHKDHGGLSHKDRWIDFQKSLQRKKSKGPVTILGVMVSSGPNFVDAENRIRTRYAVVSGLATSRYRPEIPEYIAYLEGPDLDHVHKKNAGHKEDGHKEEGHVEHHHLPKRVPYEWFVPVDDNSDGSKGSVLVLWFDDRHFFRVEEGETRPLRNLQVFFRHLVAKKDNFKWEIEKDSDSHSHSSKNIAPTGKEAPVKHVGYKLVEPDFNNLRFVVIGPPHSGQLKAMFRESVNRSSQEELKKIPKIEIFSTRATKDEEQILGKSGISISEHLQPSNVHFLRTTPTDLVLAQALVKELKLRGVTRSSPVALVSEWDTDYGRAFKKTICKAWGSVFPDINLTTDKNKNPCDDFENIHYFSYLRGLDGQLPEPEDDKKDQKKSFSEDFNLNSETASSLRAERERQYDYLMRLAEEVGETEKRLKPYGESDATRFNPRFEAFGVLGSDYYDKLVVLQALRRQFSHAHFFTTDMDARFFHGSDYKYVRNLIVASGFGLRLRGELQKSIPPFRDTYQTSAYLATRMAFNPDPSCPPMTQKNMDQWLQPRVFEVGRTQAFDLSENHFADYSLCGLVGIPRVVEDVTMQRVPSLHPHPAPLIPPYKTPAFVLLIVILTLLLCLKLHNYWKGIVWTALMLVFYVFYVVHLNGKVDEEPFAFFEGVSLWPTDFFRLAGILLAVTYLGYVDKKLSKDWSEIETTFKLDSNEVTPKEEESTRVSYSMPKRVWKVISGTFFENKDKKSDQSTVWVPYSERTFWSGVFLRSVGFVGVGVFIMHLFGFPFVPVRGDFSRVLDFSILVLFIASFAISLFYTGVHFKESTGLIQFLNDQKNTPDWSDETIQSVFEGLDTSDYNRETSSSKTESCRNLLNDLISLRFIGKRTDVTDELIYFPFALMAIGLLSRARIFDSWDFPVTLISIFVFGALYLLYKAWSIQNEAKKRKAGIIARLKIRQIHYKIQGEGKMEDLSRLLIEDTENYKEGAFLPFVEHPFFKAMLLPFSGFGGMALLEYMFLAV